MAEQPKKIINIDEGDHNADWIKLVNGGKSREQELAIHEELAKQYAAEAGEEVADETEPAADAEAVDDTEAIDDADMIEEEEEM